jgi:hypothetical protein
MALVLGAAGLLLTALLAIGTVLAWALISETVAEGVTVVVNDPALGRSAPQARAGGPGRPRRGRVAAIGALLLGVGLVVPLVLALALLVVGLAVAAVLAAVGVAFGVALSPLWLPLLLMWLLLRPSRRRLASSPA